MKNSYFLSYSGLSALNFFVERVFTVLKSCFFGIDYNSSERPSLKSIST